jgi:hypothetical protein
MCVLRNTLQQIDPFFFYCYLVYIQKKEEEKETTTGTSHLISQ